MNPHGSWSTGDPQIDVLAGLLLIGLLAYLFRLYQLKRETIHETARSLCLSAIVFGTSVYALPPMGIEKNLAIVMGFFGAAFIYGQRKRASRHISRSMKEALETRDLKGEAYDPSKHHIDHLYPFSKGGDTSFNNLRIIPKEENLKKGAKIPGFWDLLK